MKTEAEQRLRALEAPSATEAPPGSRVPATLQSLRWFRDPVRFMERNRARFGTSFSVRLGPLNRCTMIGDAELAWPVLTGSPDLVRMGSTNGIFRPVLGSSSLFLLDGSEHRRHRRLIAPAFHGQAVRRFDGLVSELTARELASWPLDTPFPIQERMRAITLELIFRAVIGVVEPERDQRLRALIHELLDQVQNPIAVLPMFQRELGGRTPFARLMALVAEIDRLLYDEISARRHDPSASDRDDILSMLVGPQPQHEGFLSDRQIRDELLTLLIAGHETTATSLAWTFERLLRHPEALRRLQREREAAAPEGAYLDAVVRESLRQRPVLPITARKLTRPAQLGPWTFPKGWTLMPCIYLIHHDPEVFPEPERFRPERFLGPGAPSRRIWLPFGAGTRHCIGSSLSLAAIKGILRTVLSRAELRPDRERAEAAVRRNFTLGPEHGARVVLIDRRRPQMPVGQPDPGGQRLRG